MKKKNIYKILLVVILLVGSYFYINNIIDKKVSKSVKTENINNYTDALINSMRPYNE